jgi:hypothetical protein
MQPKWIALGLFAAGLAFWRRSSVPQAPRDWPNIRTRVNAVIGYTAPFRIKAGPTLHDLALSLHPSMAAV